MAASENKTNNSISFDPVASFASGTKGLAVRRSSAVALKLTGHRACFHVKRHEGDADCICGSVGWNDLIRGWMDYDGFHLFVIANPGIGRNASCDYVSLI